MYQGDCRARKSRQIIGGQVPILSREMSCDALHSVGPGQVRYGGIRWSSASPPRPSCDGSRSSVWPSPRQTPGPPCPYPSDSPPSDHRPGRRQAHYAHILQIDIDQTQPRLRGRHSGMVQPLTVWLDEDEKRVEYIARSANFILWDQYHMSMSVIAM